METNKNKIQPIHPPGHTIAPDVESAPPSASPVRSMPLLAPDPVAASITTPAVAKASSNGVKDVFRHGYVKWIVGTLGLMLLVGGSVYIGARLAKRPVQVITNNGVVTESGQVDQSTLNIDAEKHTVGVATTKPPDGLQVGATVTTTPQGAANIRVGLLQNDPSVIFEDGQKSQWRISQTKGALEFVQGTDTRAKLDGSALTLSGSLNVNGNTTVGKDGSSVLTVQGNKVDMPNGLNFGGNTLVIGKNGTVAVGAANPGSYKLLVAGSFKASSVFSDGQVLATAGSVKGPSFAFNNNANTGIFEPALNMVGVSAGGSEVLRVQQGVVTIIGANLEADGYLRAGRGGSNPAFQVLRFTGSLDGSGNASIGTGLGNGASRVLEASAWYKGNSSEAVPMGVDSVSGNSMVISGGIPGRPFRATIIYAQDASGW